MSVNLPSTSGLNLRILLTTILVFGFVTAIMGSLLYASGIRGTGAVLAWMFVSFFMITVQWYFGPVLIKWATQAKELKKEQAPELHDIVENLCSLAKIPKPKLYIVNNQIPNAFAFGRTQKDSGIAVHSGLLQSLNKEEIEGVIAHEIGHIKHRDVFVMTLASVIPVILYYAVILFGNRDDRRGGSPIVVWIGAFVAQFIGQLLVMWLSRKREFYADAFAAYATKKPQHLMSALAKITYSGSKSRGNADSMVKAFYFSSPSAGESKFASEIISSISNGNEIAIAEAIQKEKKRAGFEFLSSHPMTYKRLEALLRIKKEIGS